MRVFSAGCALLVAAVLISTVSASAQKKGKSPKTPDLELVECSIHRQEGRVSVEGRVKNVGVKTINKLTLLFDFFAPGHEPLTTKRGELETEKLAPGEEAEFRWELADPVRAVNVEVRAEDGSGRDLLTVRTGPFPIE
jgi:hypothetical protein